ncbi:MAG: GNAT family N-acetyltransferase [Candidatus Latescibacteria bacterium]|nr:GNAT family N-acetyltransferase [Candidatus Latescibacterota bacterium]
MGNIEYRIGTLAELATVVSFKIRMFQEVGADTLLADDASSTIGQEYERLFQKEDLQHFVAVEEEEIVACAVGLIKRDTPFCFFRTPFYGFVADVYTVPESRRLGHARQLTHEVLSWLERKGVRTVRLQPSAQAKSLYKELGFQESGEMVLHFD